MSLAGPCAIDLHWLSARITLQALLRQNLGQTFRLFSKLTCGGADYGPVQNLIHLGRYIVSRVVKLATMSSKSSCNLVALRIQDAELLSTPPWHFCSMSSPCFYVPPPHPLWHSCSAPIPHPHVPLCDIHFLCPPSRTFLFHAPPHPSMAFLFCAPSLAYLFHTLLYNIPVSPCLFLFPVTIFRTLSASLHAPLHSSMPLFVPHPTMPLCSPPHLFMPHCTPSTPLCTNSYLNAPLPQSKL